MLIEPLLGYKSTWRILDLLFETPRKPISRKELFQHTKLGNAPLSRALLRLERAGILVYEKRGKNDLYYLNENNNYAKHIQEIFKSEIFSLRNLPYELRTILSELIRNLNDANLNISKMILFGSQAKGTASIHSDIDLAIIFSDKIENEIWISKITNQLKKKFNKDIQTHYFTEKNFNEKNKLVEEIKRDGINLTS